MIWQLIFALFGVQWVMSFSIKDSLLSWHSSFVGKKRKKMWNAAPLCLFCPYGEKEIEEPLKTPN